jgi:hypothetical protein
MHFVALTELPQGQQPGDVIDVHEDVGHVLITVGAARVATDDEIKKAQRRPRRYQRRDMVAAEA